MFNIFNKKKKSQPNSQTRIIGVSGSHGKTVLTHLITHILHTNGLNVAALSSVGEFSPDGTFVEKNSVNKLKKKDIEDFLIKSIDEKPDFIVLEMPFTQIYRGYFDSIEIDAGVITYIDNLFSSTDFWDFATEALPRFIDGISQNGLLIANASTPQVAELLADLGNKIHKDVYCYWTSKNDLNKVNISIDGVSYTTGEQEEIKTKLHGENNTFLSYLALKVCSRYLGVEKIKEAIETFAGVRGRLDLVKYNRRNFFIDNSKSFDEITNNLKYINALKNAGSKIFLVLGQDENASQVIPKDLNSYADVILLAATDPNNLHTSNINSDLFNQLESHGSKLIERVNSSEEMNMINSSSLKNKIHLINQAGETASLAFDSHDYSSRLDAIRFAKDAAEAGDFILVSGKGNEDFIVFSNAEYEWSDYEALDIVHKD